MILCASVILNNKVIIKLKNTKRLYVQIYFAKLTENIYRQKSTMYILMNNKYDKKKQENGLFLLLYTKLMSNVFFLYFLF